MNKIKEYIKDFCGTEEGRIFMGGFGMMILIISSSAFFYIFGGWSFGVIILSGLIYLVVSAHRKVMQKRKERE